jgi:hypothetical protein
MLELLYTSNKILTIPAPGEASFFAYLAAWDAFLLSDGLKLYKVFRDGSQFPIGVPPGVPGNRVGSDVFWNVGGICYASEDLTGQYQPQKVLNPTWTFPPFDTPGTYLDDTQGIVLSVGSQGVIPAYRLSNGSALPAITLPNWSPHVLNSLAPVGPAKVLAFNQTGLVALVNYLLGQVLWSGMVDPCQVAAFDSKNNLVVTLGSDLKIRIYLTTPKPASLSNPEFYPAVTKVSREIGYQVRTRLTGSNGELCPGMVVNWIPPNLGTLAQTQTLTDSEGYAYNTYFAPAVATGSDTLITFFGYPDIITPEPCRSLSVVAAGEVEVAP